VHIVGWQPLHRPEQQRAFVVKMKPEQDFCSLPTLEKFHFQHDADISHRIWSAFDQGNALFPRDAAAELAIRAEFLAAFTTDQIEQAWQRLEHWTGVLCDVINRDKIQIACGITVIDTPLLSWDGLDVETSPDRLNEQFNEVMNRVRYRLVAY
jgi:hypothetical protein